MAFLVNSWTLANCRPHIAHAANKLHPSRSWQTSPTAPRTSITARQARPCQTPRASALSTNAKEKALIFDCDGVIVESEELHRISYNQCWEAADLGFEWSYEFYEQLQNSIGGGKEKMRWYFGKYGWPDGHPADINDVEVKNAREEFVVKLHVMKTDLYQQLIRDGRASVRAGVLRLMDEAHVRGLRTAICSASNARAVHFVLDTLVGKTRLSKFDVILAGDDVKVKKPDPMIYNVAREKLGVRVEDCVVIEDTQIGLQAGMEAGMKVVITYTPYTATQQFDGAAIVLPGLGEEGNDIDKVVNIDILFPELAGAPVPS